MRETKGDRTRKKIIEASIHAFALKGFANASFREIAETAGVKTPLIAHHFESKYSLYQSCISAVLDHIAEILSEMITVEDNALRRLEKNFLTNLTLADQFPQEVKIIVFLYSTAAHDAKFKDIYSALLKRTRMRLLEVIHSGIRENVFHIQNDPELIAEIVHEHIIGSIVNYLSGTRRTGEKDRLKAKWAELIFCLTGAKSALSD